MKRKQQKKTASKQKEAASKQKKIVPKQEFLTKKWSVILLVVAAFIVYIPVFQNDFVNFDDNVLIYDNPVIVNDAKPFSECFRNKLFGAHYKPFVFLTWKLEYKFFGKNPLVFHINNLLLHILNTLLVFFISLRLFKRFNRLKDNRLMWAFIGALFFAIHPMHVESVAWATERKDVLFSFFFLASWLLYIRYIEQGKWLLLLLSAILYLCSVLSKSMGITLIAIYFITDWLYNRKIHVKLIFEKIPAGIVFITALYLFGMFTRFTQQASGLTAGIALKTYEQLPANLEHLPGFAVRVCVLSARFFLWIVHLLIPVKLSIIYSRIEVLASLGVFIYLIPVLIAGGAVFFFIYRNRYKEIAWGLLFFTITLMPALAISDVGVGIFISDRYTYIPSYGIFIALLALLAPLAQKNRSTLFTIVAILTLFWGGKCFAQTKIWRNSKTLWSNVVKIAPQSPLGYNSIGRYHRFRKEYDEAYKYYTQAIKADPTFYKAYLNRGKILFDQKRYKEALADFNNLVKYKPDLTEGLSNRGAVLSLLGRHDEAIKDFDKAISLNPRYLSAYQNRSLIYLNKKNYSKALEDIEMCLKLAPRNVIFHTEKGSLLIQLKRYEEALSALNHSLQINNKSGIAWYKRSLAHFYLKNYSQAANDLKQAEQLGIKPPASYKKVLTQRAASG